MRKIVQIAAASATDRSGGLEERAFALCDDGTLWSSWFDWVKREFRWERLPDIPQEAPHD